MDKPTDKSTETGLMRMTAHVVAAYVSNNSLPNNQLTGLINGVYSSLKALDAGAPEPKQEQTRPAISVKKSITPDYLVCLEDGKKLKMLKRHLRSTYNMTPEEYRAKWNLSADYPMVAPNYAAQRSAFAKEIGLGRGSSRTPRAKNTRMS